MATRIFGASKGNRRPTQVAPSKTPTQRPTAQKGGGGNKAAGSVEPTAANTPTVSVSPTGVVTPEHFGPSQAERREVRQAKTAVRESRRRVRKVRSYVKQRDKELTPKREVRVSKDFLNSPDVHATVPKPVTVASHERAKPGATRPSVPVAEHQRALPTRAEKQEARQNVKQARQVVAKTTGVTGPLTRSQKVMAKQIAKETGLKPKTVATQELQEESGEAAQQREAEGNFNALNIGYFDSGPGELTKDPTWSNPHTAAKATSEFFKGQKYGPSEGIRNILPASKGKSSAEQLNIIGNSGWATSDYATNLAATSNLVGEKHNPKAVKNLKAAVKEAKELGLKVSSTGIQSPGKPTKQTVTKFQQIKHAADELESKNLPYSWGGGHDPNFSPGGEGENGGPGYDCSGAVSFVLHQAGVLDEPLTSGSMGSVLKPGPGAVTVFYNAEHTFMKIGDEYWGTSVGDAGAGGIGKHPAPSADYLAQYNVGHVPGLGRKQALQLGFKPGSFVSEGGTAAAFPGMSFSEGGTTATIEEGQGTKVEGKAKFSKEPILLTPLQQINRRVRRLKHLGVEVAGPGQETKAEAANKPGDSSLHKQLAELEAKYSIGAV
jgi:hypothetical protein